MSTTKQVARTLVEKLVRYFERNVHQLKSASFNEAQTRQHLIDPLFIALGWDVRNSELLPPYRLEVIPEGRVKTTVGKVVKEETSLFDKGVAVKEDMAEYTSMLEYIADDEYKADTRLATKKPDYRFRIQGSTKFFVEAKKPSVDLMNNLDAIFQIKRYGFSARVPISILTDFEQFRVFDCTRKPFYDKPKLGVIKEFDLSYKAYLDEFDRLYDTFSREAVAAGSIDALQKKYLEKGKGEFALDRSFLDDLQQWRVELAKDIAGHPKNRRILNTYTLNECVQRILDRIVFLRVCEDRTIEETGTLLALLRLWQDHPGLSLYEQFNKLIATRRSLYNGLLFTEHECERLEVGNKVLEKVFKNINYPLSPYNFDEIGVEILGSIYERFLGKTIRLTKKQVRVEEKPEVRKAGGVYYTPQYIVNYIVENTLGRLLYEDATPSLSPPSEGGDVPTQVGTEGVRKLKLTPKQIEKLKIIDIACGSGSFLLGAFQKLTDYHVEWYTQHPEDIKEVHGVRDAYEDQQGQLHLSARKKREILVNNIYGVDIDQQAVEVTQMSLYLKVLENENDATLNKPTMLALHEVLLPPLKNNIKCGNSLIGTDFLAQGELFDEEARRKVNPFDWEMEFAGIMNGGGFDVVIGNPPYLSATELLDYQKNYFKSKYRSAVGRLDTYALFIERALTIVRNQGLIGYIIPNKFLTNIYFSTLRDHILNTAKINALNLIKDSVFLGAAVNSVIVVLQKEARGHYRDDNVISIYESNESESRESRKVAQSIFKIDEQKRFLVSYEGKAHDVMKRVKSNPTRFEELFDVRDGIIAGRIKDLLFLSSPKNRFCKKLIFGDDMSRYVLQWKGKWVNYRPDRMKSEEKRRVGKLGIGLRLREPEIFETTKIITRKTADRIIATLDEEGYYFEQTVHASILRDKKYSEKYFLAILNSKLYRYFYQKEMNQEGTIFPQVRIGYLKQLPIHTIDFTKPEEKQMHDELVALVDKMLELHKQLVNLAKVPDRTDTRDNLRKVIFASEKEPIERQIAATDRKIDELVYKLYGLTEEEVSIIEREKLSKKE